MLTQATGLELILAGTEFSMEELARIAEALGEKDLLALCNSEEGTLTDIEKRQLRRDAAEEILKIPALQDELVDFKERGTIRKIPLANLYHRVMVGDDRIRSLEFAVRTLMDILKDARIPDQYRGLPTDNEPRAVRLAIESALAARREEFKENLKQVPRLVREFFGASDNGDLKTMNGVFNKLASKNFKGAVAKHNNCAIRDTVHFYNGLRKEMGKHKSA